MFVSYQLKTTLNESSQCFAKLFSIIFIYYTLCTGKYHELLALLARVLQARVTIVGMSESQKISKNLSATYQKWFCSLLHIAMTLYAMDTQLALNSQAKRVLYSSMLSVGVVTTSDIAGVVEICKLH